MSRRGGLHQTPTSTRSSICRGRSHTCCSAGCWGALWNGSGYPRGVAGEEIPLTAPVTAIADTFDAITHKRPYKDARTIEDALAVILRASGTLFDPAVVDAFLTLDHTELVNHAHT